MNTLDGLYFYRLILLLLTLAMNKIDTTFSTSNTFDSSICFVSNQEIFNSSFFCKWFSSKSNYALISYNKNNFPVGAGGYCWGGASSYIILRDIILVWWLVLILLDTWYKVWVKYFLILYFIVHNNSRFFGDVYVF